MALTAWRISKKRYERSAFDGEGSRRVGGRWSSRGTALAYASSSLALAMLEVLVHVEKTRPLAQYVAIPVTFAERHLLEVPLDELPPAWRTWKPPAGARRIGDVWAESRASLVLRVPSVLLPEAVYRREHTFLINPLHRDFGALEVGPSQALGFDPRLL